MTDPTLETLAELWRKGMEHAAADFRHRHVTAYRKMLDGVMRDYDGAIGGFDRRMQQLDRACAFSNGYLSFDLWLQTQERAA